MTAASTTEAAVALGLGADPRALRAHEAVAARLLGAVAADMGGDERGGTHAASGRVLRFVREGRFGEMFLELNDE